MYTPLDRALKLYELARIRYEVSLMTCMREFIERDYEQLMIARENLAIIANSRPSEATRPEAPARLIVVRNPPIVTLDGTTFGVSEAQAAFVDILHQNAGRVVTPADFTADPILAQEKRRDRIKAKLPRTIRDLIEGKPGGGYKLTLA